MSKRHIRLRLYKDQFGFCAYCFNKMTMRLDMPNTCTIDHVLAKSDGGASAYFNYVGSCADCNQEKGRQSLVQFLLNKPKRARRYKDVRGIAA